MWICENCGEANTDPAACEVCGHPYTAPPPAPWEPTAAGREPPPYRWEPTAGPAPGFRGGPPPPAPRNAPPAVAGPLIRTPQPDPDLTWIPEPADPDPPERRCLVPALPIAVLVATLAAAVVVAGPRLLRSAQESPSASVTSPTTTTAATPPTTTPITENATIDLVTVDPAVTDPRAPDIAAMFETYFTGINEKDYTAVAGVFDPDGAIDPADPDQMAAFSDGTATTEDSDVVILEISDLANGRIRAGVTFRSEQEPGDGPVGRRDETCTRWQVGYTLTTTTGDGYRIFRGKGASEPC